MSARRFLIATLALAVMAFFGCEKRHDGDGPRHRPGPPPPHRPDPVERPGPVKPPVPPPAPHRTPEPHRDGGSHHGGAMPKWLEAKLAEFERMPRDRQPIEVSVWMYKGQTVYLIVPKQADRYSELYDGRGKIIGHPSGGLRGRGDGRCRDFSKERRGGEVIWTSR